jgi:hypothetical protein
MLAALDYAAMGWRVFPLAGKAPRTLHGHLDATGDPEVIRSWWARWPHANIGAPVPDRLLVLDVDPRNGGDITTLGSLPETLTCWSGRGDGGRHLYFLRPPGPMTSTRLPGGIDLKLNGYCVIPPSIHPDTGRPYRWEHHPVAHLPHHLREVLRPPPAPIRPAVRRSDGRALVEFVARQPEGNRNRGLFWAACAAAEDGVLDEIAEDLVAAAVAAGHPEASARRTVASARKKATV